MFFKILTYIRNIIKTCVIIVLQLQKNLMQFSNNERLLNPLKTIKFRQVMQ